MKKIMQYLPFILWSISTIILTILAFIILPVLLAWEKFNGYIRKDVSSRLQKDKEYENTYALPVCN
jgi:succinate dehydrogenase/fumarate reductase cytochrome b subunit